MNPLTNKVVGMEVMNHKWTLVIRVFWNYVDGLIFLSAFATAFHAAQHLKAGKKLDIFKMYLRRYIRYLIGLSICGFLSLILFQKICDSLISCSILLHLFGAVDK